MFFSHSAPKLQQNLIEIFRNQTVFRGIYALTPGTDKFGDIDDIKGFCKQYGLISEGNRTLEMEIGLMKDIFQRDSGDHNDLPSSLHGMLKFIAPHERILHILFKCIKIALTIPISSGGVERSFSAMNRINNYLRSSMGNDRLSDLGVLNVNIEMTKDLDKDRIIDKFAERNERRIVLR